MDRQPHIEDLLKDGRALDKIDRDRAELFEPMVKTPGWLAYVEVLNSMIEQRGTEILGPAGSVDGAMRLEYIKGAMFGLLLARDLPSVTIQQMSASRPATELPDEND